MLIAALRPGLSGARIPGLDTANKSALEFSGHCLIPCHGVNTSVPVARMYRSAIAIDTASAPMMNDIVFAVLIFMVTLKGLEPLYPHRE